MDLINGIFELGGAFAIWLSIMRLYADKEAKGVHWGHLGFFTSWGVWNIFYYSSLDQWFSWGAGIALCLSNGIYLGQVIYYGRKNAKSSKP